MARFSIYSGLLLIAGVFSGCCYPGSPHCHLNYPNLIGYTYPNWCPPPLKTPPNGPPDEVLEEMQNAEITPEAEDIPAGVPAPLPDENEASSILSMARS